MQNSNQIKIKLFGTLFFSFFILITDLAYAEEPEVITVTGSREPPPAPPPMSSNPRPGGAIFCKEIHCGKGPPEPRDEPQPVSSFDTTEAKLVGEDLLAWLRRMWKLKSAFGRTNFMCRADIVCQSETDLGLKCQAIGTYFTADEAYSNFSHDSCCEREKKGHQIGLEWKNCRLY